MAIITNTHKTALGLPGITLQPNMPTPVHNWETLRKNHVVQAWLKAGILVENEQAVSKFVQADKDELLAKLAALGHTPDKRTGIPKLQILLDEAEKAAGAVVTNVSKDVPPGTGPFSSQD